MKLLEGIKVLDFTRVLAGPFSTMILADLGAEVIKVERPGHGDDSRSFGPFIKDRSAYYMSLNRNKKSISVDVKKEEGVLLLKELIKGCDVLVENFRPGVMDKLGLGYETCKELNSGLVYASCSGFGQSGPYSEYPAYDIIVQAMGGIMSITGMEGGEYTRVGASVGDITAGIFTAIGILGSLCGRAETGQGARIDISMLDCQVAILENAISRYLVNGEVPKPLGNRHPSVYPFESFLTGDGSLVVAIGSESLWTRFCKALGRHEWIGDDRFDSNKKREDNYGVLRPMIEETLSTRDSGQWLEIFDKLGIPSSRVQKIDEIMENEQVLSRNMIVDMDDPVAGRIKIPGNPIKVQSSGEDEFLPAPDIGQDNEDVILSYIGYSREEIEELYNGSVLFKRNK